MIGKLMMMEFFCPKCGSKTHAHQWKERCAWSSDSLVPKIMQLRVLCQNKECRSTHVILPDFLNPYKRYVGLEIEASIEYRQEKSDEVAPATDADESTIYRWNAQFLKRFEKIIQILIRLLIGMEIMPNLMQQEKGFERLKKILNRFPQIAFTTHLGQTNMLMYANGSLEYF
jgi:Domain of unknown function (DUF6431)